MILTPFFLIEEIALAGSSFEKLSLTTNVITIKTDEEFNKAFEKVTKARVVKKSGLTKEELAKIEREAKEVFDQQALIVEQLGASVFAGSQVID